MKCTTHASLFSGIGGFDLASEWAGWTNEFMCEIDPFCQKILKYHFPKTKLYDDIKKTDFTEWNGRIDVVSGGFPCQPFSVAGKRKGTDDDRYLWPEMLRAIRDIKPEWVVAENVSGLITQQRGVVFESVCADLENIGYEVQPFVIPACSVDAPHRRDRVWIIAHRADAGIKNVQLKRENGVCEHKTIANAESVENNRWRQGGLYSKSSRIDVKRITSNSESIGLSIARNSREWRDGFTHEYFPNCGKCECCDGHPEWKNENDCEWITPHSNESGFQRSKFIRKSERFEQGIPNWQNFPTQSPVRGRNDGISGILDDFAILEGKKPRKPWSAWSKLRNESMKAYGNAIVPQVAYEIFKTINKTK